MSRACRGASLVFLLIVLLMVLGGAAGCSRSFTREKGEGGGGGTGAGTGGEGGSGGGQAGKGGSSAIGGTGGSESGSSGGGQGGSAGAGANAGGAGEEGSCVVNGITYPSGSSGIPWFDGCNGCTCVDGTLVCTDRACVRQGVTIELYVVEREGWRDDEPPVEELARWTVGDPVLFTEDIISYEWSNHVMRVSEAVGERWYDAGLVDENLFSMEPVLFLIYLDDEASFAVVLWPPHLSSLPPYPDFFPVAVDEHVELHFHLTGRRLSDLNDARLYRALWKSRLLLDPASGENTCAVDGVRYPDGTHDIQSPWSCNLCVCAGGEALACTERNCPVEQTEYSEIVNGWCAQYVTIDNPVFRNGIIFLDCGAAVDGLAYYFDEAEETLISTCGGACLTPDPEQQEMCRTLCPPPGW